MAEAKIRFQNFLGGLNFAVSENNLKANETQKAQNVDISDGNLALAKGYTKYSTTSLSGIKSLMKFYKTNTDGTVTGELLVATDTAIYKYANGSYILLRSGLSNGYWDYLNYKQNMTDIMIMGNGIDPMLKYDGASIVDLGGTPPRMKSIGLHYERVWGTGDRSNPNMIYYSEPLNPEGWTIDPNKLPEDRAGMIDLPTWDGGVCIGLSTIFDDVVVFKTRNIFRVVGTYPGEYKIVEVFSSTGAIAERTIVSAGKYAFFLTKDGIYVYNGMSTEKLGGSKIDGIKINNAYADKACAIVYKNKLYVAIPEGDSTVNNAVIEYDIEKGYFMVHRGFTVTAFCEFNDKLLFTDGSYIYEWGSGYTYDGLPIQAYWETPESDFGQAANKKRVMMMYLTAEGNGKLELACIADGTKAKYKIIDLPNQKKILKIHMRNKGRTLKFRFSNVNGSYFKIQNPEIILDIEEL